MQVIVTTVLPLCVESVPVRATRRGKQRRLARMISSMASSPGQGVSTLQYRNSNTPRIHAVLVLGMGTWEREDQKEIRKIRIKKQVVTEKEIKHHHSFNFEPTVRYYTCIIFAFTQLFILMQLIHFCVYAQQIRVDFGVFRFYISQLNTTQPALEIIWHLSWDLKDVDRVKNPLNTHYIH